MTSLVAASTRRARLIFVVALLLALAAAPFVWSLRVETATDSVLDKGDQKWQGYLRYQHEFGSDEYLAFLISGDSALAEPDLERVASLSERLGMVSGVDRVDSLSTVPALLLDGDGALIATPLIGYDSKSRLGDLLGRHRTAENWLVSSDRRSYGLNVVINDPVEEHYESVLSAAADLSSEMGIAVSGVPLFRAAADARMKSDLAWYVPVTVGAVALLVLFLTGSWAAVVVALVAPGLAVWLTLGAMGMSGVPLSITTVVIPPVLLALGCAYVMHFLCALTGRTVESLGSTLEGVARPIAMSGLTTAIGFLGLAAVRIEAINLLGVFGAFGVAALTFLTLTLTPAIAVLVGLEVQHRSWDALVSRFAAGVWTASERRPALTIAVWSAVVGVGALGASQVKVSTNVIDWFNHEEPVRADYESIRRELAGISPMPIVLRSNGSSDVMAPVVLDHMRSFLADMRLKDGVGHAIGVSDMLDQLSAELVQEAVVLPVSRAQTEQLLLLIEGEPIFKSLVAHDRMAATLFLRLDNNDSSFIRQLAFEAEQWWRSAEVPGIDVEATGVMLAFARSQDEIVYGQMRGLSVALAAIALVIVVAFRSLFLAAVCLVVNLLPLLLAVACLWLVGAPMDAATAVITCLTLGIAVDDSLHLVFQREKARGKGFGRIRSGGEALAIVARPVVFSTLAVAAGFGVLGFSGFLPVANLGLVTAGAMLICMLADLSLMPALLAFERD